MNADRTNILWERAGVIFAGYGEDRPGGEEKVTLDYVLNHHRHNSHRNSPYSDSETYTVQSPLAGAGTGVAARSKQRRWEME